MSSLRHLAIVPCAPIEGTAYAEERDLDFARLLYRCHAAGKARRAAEDSDVRNDILCARSRREQGAARAEMDAFLAMSH